MEHFLDLLSLIFDAAAYPLISLVFLFAAGCGYLLSSAGFSAAVAGGTAALIFVGGLGGVLLWATIRGKKREKAKRLLLPVEVILPLVSTEKE